ncbi:MAG: hypothetical protein GY877_09435 [Hyphomicrobium sp.]|nr:hypothetical protein [Hyphomicrobium sp.]
MDFCNAHDDTARADFLGRYGWLEPDADDCARRDFVKAQAKMRKILELASPGDTGAMAQAINSLHDPADWFQAIPYGDSILFKHTSLAALMHGEVRMVIERGVRLAVCEREGCENAVSVRPPSLLSYFQHIAREAIRRYD